MPQKFTKYLPALCRFPTGAYSGSYTNRAVNNTTCYNGEFDFQADFPIAMLQQANIHSKNAASVFIFHTYPILLEAKYSRERFQKKNINRISDPAADDEDTQGEF